MRTVEGAPVNLNLVAASCGFLPWSPKAEITASFQKRNILFVDVIFGSS